MRKARSYPCQVVELTRTPKFHCGDDVEISLNAKSPKGKFFSGFCGTIGDIDTWWEKEYFYKVVLHHCDCGHCVIPQEVWITESDLEFSESYMWDEDDDVFCVYVPHGVETSLTPEEIKEKYIYQWDDWEGVYYCTVSKEDYEAWLFDDIIDDDEDEEEIEEKPAKKIRKSSKKH